MRRPLAQSCAIALLAAAAAGGAAAQEPRLSGHVVDYTGTPVQTADLDFFHPITGDKIDPSPPDRPQSDKTDATGFYSMLVTSGLYRIRFQPPPARTDLAPLTFFDVLVVADTTIDVTLPRGYALTGQVTDPSGGGVISVDLDVLNEATGERYSPPGDLTNFLGLYQLIVADGTYSVYFTPPVSTHLVPRVMPHVEVHADTPLDVQLATGFTVQGEAQDAGGAPVTGVDLDFDDTATHERAFTPNDATDPSGRYALTVAGGTYDIGFTPPASLDLAGVLLHGVALSADTTLPAVRFTAGARVTVSSRSPYGVPLVGAHLVTVEDATGATFPTPNADTDDGGLAHVRVTPGRYRFVLVPPAGSGLDTLTGAPVDVAADTTIALDYERGSAVSVAVAVRVVDAPHEGSLVVWTTPRNGEPLATATAGADGAVELLLLPGYYDLAVTAGPGLEPDSVLFLGMLVRADTTLVASFGTAPSSIGPGLSPASSNPFRGTMVLRLVLPAEEDAVLTLVDVMGRRVRRVPFAARAAGTNVVSWTWDGTDERGVPAPEGCYHAVLAGATRRASIRLVRLP